MYCVHCGAQLDETARFCPQCGASINSTPNQSSLGGAESPLNASYDAPYAYGGSYDRAPNYDASSEPINDFLVWNILATLFCCMPCGVAGLVFSCLCISAKGRGDFQKAAQNAAAAKILFWVSFGLGLVMVFVGACLLLLEEIGNIADF